MYMGGYCHPYQHEPFVQEPISTAPRQKILSLEVARGIAAMLVVMHHAARFFEQPRYGGTVLFGGIFGEFHFAVDFFFVLSGFIIAWVHWDEIGQRNRLGHYAQRRFTRVYPPYWAVLIPLVILYQIFPQAGLDSQRDWGTIIMSFFLLPQANPPVLGVAWTLVHEVFFYALFGLILYSGKPMPALLPLWGIAILAANQYALEGILLPFIFNAYNLEFLLGILTALTLRRTRIAMPALWLCAGAGGFFYALFASWGIPLMDYPVITRLLFGSLASISILGMVELERSGRLKLHASVRMLGSASYAIYLTHTVALSFTLVLLWRYMQHLPPTLNFAILVTVGVIAGTAFHYLIERPLTRWMRRFSRSAAEKAA